MPGFSKDDAERIAAVAAKENGPSSATWKELRAELKTIYQRNCSPAKASEETAGVNKNAGEGKANPDVDKVVGQLERAIS